MTVFETLCKSILDVEASLVRRLCFHHQFFKFYIEKYLMLYTILVDAFVPDKLILSYLNILDRIIKPQRLLALFDRMVVFVSPQARSDLVEVADYLELNTATNSRKICAVVAYAGKYIADWMIPQESADAWANLKLKFHVPTLLSRKQQNPLTET